jgi:hypothetical protein
MAGLPPPPIQDKPGSFTWLEWYRQLREYVSTSGSVPWYIINFAGSNITDIALRDHDQLQNVQGGTAGEHNHLTDAEYTQIQDNFHDSTVGIQGGTSGEYYHLTNTEHTALTNSTQGTWTPTFTNLTVVPGTGAASYAGRYSRIGRTVFFTVKISCTGTATTAATAGTTYCDLPIAASQDDSVTTVNKTTLLGIGTGVLDSTNDRCYPSSWTATGNTIIISGKYEV